VKGIALHVPSKTSQGMDKDKNKKFLAMNDGRPACAEGHGAHEQVGGQGGCHQFGSLQHKLEVAKDHCPRASSTQTWGGGLPVVRSAEA